MSKRRGSRFLRPSLGRTFSLMVLALVFPLLLVGITIREGLSTNASELIDALRVKELMVTSVGLMLVQQEVTRSMLLDPDRLDEAEQNAEAAERRIQIAEEVRRLTRSPEIRVATGALLDLERKELKPLDAEITAALVEGRVDVARDLLEGRFQNVATRYSTLAATLGREAGLAAKAAEAGMVERNRASMLRVSFALLLGIALVAAVVLAVSRGIRLRIRRVQGALESVAGGDLSQRLSIDREDEIGQIADSVNRMTIRLERRGEELARSHADLLDARDAAEASSRAKSEFLANMSHELRTPMNGILGIAELLLVSTLDDEQKDLAQTLQRSSESLLAIINQVLDYSRLADSKMEVERVPFELETCIRDAVQVLKPVADEKGLSLSVNVSDPVPRQVIGDAQKLRQVLLNLGGNAVKFSDHGRVEFRVECPDLRGDGVSLRFTVRDEGPGISGDKLDEIFDRFTQADASTTRTHGGTGLGLAITKQLVELMRGEIEVESEVGRGSTFSFLLPFGVATEAVDRYRPDGSGLRSGTRVLLAEDNAVNRKVASRILEKLGCRVEIAHNGREAVAKFECASYDAILMDCQMPEMDGYDATRRIRSLEDGPPTPIIACTANALVGDRERCLEAGMSDYIAKPLTPKGVEEVLARWLSPLEDAS